MPIDPDSFKRAMSNWASGVSVVTCRHDGAIHGMTASSFTSLSLDPPLILVCVARTALTHHLLEAGGHFAVNVLGSEQSAISDRCAGFLGEPAHLLDDLDLLDDSASGAVLSDALAWFDCRVWAGYPGGDHTIFVGEVLSAGCAERAPLVWHRRGYRSLTDAAPR